MLKHADIKNFEYEVLKSPKIVLVDFFATWCGPCKMLGPILETISSKRDDFDIIKIDIDENNELAYKYGIQVVPTMIIFKNGEIKETIEGLYDEKDIIAMVEKHL